MLKIKKKSYKKYGNYILVSKVLLLGQKYLGILLRELEYLWLLHFLAVCIRERCLLSSDDKIIILSLILTVAMFNWWPTWTTRGNQTICSYSNMETTKPTKSRSCGVWFIHGDANCQPDDLVPIPNYRSAWSACKVSCRRPCYIIAWWKEVLASLMAD